MWWDTASADLLTLIAAAPSPVTWRELLTWARALNIAPLMLANLIAHLDITRRIKDVSVGPAPRGKMKPPAVWAIMPEAERAVARHEASAWAHGGESHASVSGRYSSDRANLGD